MSLMLGQDIYVAIETGPDCGKAVTIEDGAFLREVTTGTRVFLPSRDYPTDPEERRSFLATLRAGRQVQVRVVDKDDAADMWSWVVSRKEFHQHDPWEHEVLGWKPGEPKQLKVTNVHGDWAYGEIIPRVEGCVDLAGLEDYVGSDRSISSVLVGDFLVGCISETDFERRLVHLDVLAYLSQLDQNQEERPPGTSLINHERSQQPIKDEPTTSFKTVLIVDDDNRYMQALERSLRADGMQVLCANDVVSARRYIQPSVDDDLGDGPGKEHPPIDLALLDVRLDQRGDPIGGIRFAKEVEETHPEIRLLLMSGDTGARQKLAQGDQLGVRVHGFLPKPFGVRRLRAELANVAMATRASPTTFLLPETASVQLGPRRADDRTTVLLDRRVRDLGARLNVQNAVLFGLHRISMVTEVVAGDKPPNDWQGRGWPFWRQKLWQSPVRDVAIDGDPFSEKDAHRTERLPRNRWLQRAYGYGSCLGFPVRSHDERAFCVFAFRAQPGSFSSSDEELMAVFAAEFAALLEKERLLRALEAETRYVTSGMAMGVMGHELRTKLATAALNADGVCELLSHSDPSVPEVRELAQDLRDAVETSVKICETFMQLARRHEPAKPVRVRDCVERGLRFAEEVAKSHHTDLYLTEVPDNLWILAEPILLEQVLFNLCVNAAEQCHQFGKRRGRVDIRAEGYDENNRHFVRLFVKDNGPGIHYCWWDKIFEPGFTTKKPDGSGLGLHICRRTLEKTRSSIHVSESDLWAGTTFRLTIPATARPAEAPAPSRPAEGKR